MLQIVLLAVTASLPIFGVKVGDAMSKIAARCLSCILSPNYDFLQFTKEDAYNFSYRSLKRE
jgi:hypothetical protein